MRLEDIFTPRRRQDPLEAIVAQLGELRRQTNHINRAVSDNAQGFAHNAHDIAGELGDAVSDWSREAAKQGAWLAGVASRKAVHGARAVQRDPIPVIAVLGTAILLTSLLARRR